LTFFFLDLIQKDFTSLRDSTNELFTFSQIVSDMSQLEHNSFSIFYDGMTNLQEIHGTMADWLGIKDEMNKYVKEFAS
jgi:hypothetical protein